MTIVKSPVEEKTRLRQRVLTLRKTTEFNRKAKSNQVLARLREVPGFNSAHIYFLYVGKPSTSEVLTGPMIEYLLARGKRVFLPKTIPTPPKRLLFGEIHAFPGDVEVGAFNVLEPKPGCYSDTQPLPDLIVVPGVAFDPRGGRIGYGQGYYDIFLQEYPGRIPIVALAYDFQVVPRVPTTSTDVRVDWVVTDRRVIDCHAAGRKPDGLA